MTKIVKNWKELGKLVEETDLVNNSLLLTGWVFDTKKKNKQTVMLLFDKIECPTKNI